MLTTDTQFLYAELMDVVRLFGEDVPDLSHTFASEGDVFRNTVVVCGQTFRFEEKQPHDGALAFKRYAKRFAKLAVYRALEAVTGRSMAVGRADGHTPDQARLCGARRRQTLRTAL